MNKGNLKGKRRTANKGLSPVIAAVILIAVTVAIAVAAGGYFFGLFSTQTSRAQASVRSTSLTALDGSPALEGVNGCNTADDHLLQLEFQNAGGLADSISSVSMPGAAVAISGTNTTSVDANVGSFTTYYCANSSTYTVGQTVSFTLRMSSGLTIPVAVTVA